MKKILLAIALVAGLLIPMAALTATPANATGICGATQTKFNSGPSTPPIEYYPLDSSLLSLKTSVDYQECNDGAYGGDYIRVLNVKAHFDYYGSCVDGDVTLDNVVLDPELVGTWEPGTRTWACTADTENVERTWTPANGFTRILQSHGPDRKCVDGTITFNKTGAADVTQSLPSICFNP